VLLADEGMAAGSGRPAVLYDSRQAQADLAGTSIVCPEPTEELLRTYVSYFMTTGFLPAPEALGAG
jgi:hypothetical protein